MPATACALWAAGACSGSRKGTQVTLVDSVRWLFEQGHISRGQAGQLATV
jgi:hypothetical protein